MHAHNEINFPQAKLDSEINVLFLLNEYGDLYLLSHNNSVHIIILNLKKFKKLLSHGKKRYRLKTYSVMNANYDHKKNDYTNTLRYVVLNGVVFRQISNDIVPYARHFLPARFFSPSITLINYASSYRKI